LTQKYSGTGWKGQGHINLTHFLPPQCHLNFNYNTAQILQNHKNCREFDNKKKKNYITDKTYSLVTKVRDEILSLLMFVTLK